MKVSQNRLYFFSRILLESRPVDFDMDTQRRKIPVFCCSWHHTSCCAEDTRKDFFEELWEKIRKVFFEAFWEKLPSEAAAVRIESTKNARHSYHLRFAKLSSPLNLSRWKQAYTLGQLLMKLMEEDISSVFGEIRKQIDLVVKAGYRWDVTRKLSGI